MTRDEIVKALRCYANVDNCPVKKCNEKCPYWLEDDKFDLYNPNAEISDRYQLCRAAADMLEKDVKHNPADIDEICALRRAEPEMRPLTLDEILAKTNEEDWNFVWLEHKKSRTPMQLCPWHRKRDKIIFCELPFDAQIAENIVEIRKTWRCWPRKPTPEQMAAEKWEE